MCRISSGWPWRHTMSTTTNFIDLCEISVWRRKTDTLRLQGPIAQYMISGSRAIRPSFVIVSSLGSAPRLAHLSALISRYYADTGNSMISPRAVSLASNAPPGGLGDYSASTHVQGELIGTLLDMLIRSNTGGRRSFDDVMRLMYQRFGGKKAFLSGDVGRAVSDAGGGPGVRGFLDTCLSSGRALDFDPYLRLLGLRLQLTWQPAVDDKGLLVADSRIYVWEPPGDSIFHLILTTPQSCWGRAGLHTGDGVVAVNGQVLRDRAFFYTAIHAAKRGDTITFQLRNGAKVVVPITGYVQARASLSRIEGTDAVAQARFREWLAGR
jgi:hypothetical protein